MKAHSYQCRQKDHITLYKMMWSLFVENLHRDWISQMIVPLKPRSLSGIDDRG
jgi:hypothetical protein